MRKIVIPLVLAFALMACSDYGKKVSSSNIEVYYKEGISKEQAEKTASLFAMALNASNPNDKATKSFQLLKTGDTVLMKMVADKAKLGTVGDESFYAMCTLISDSVFAGGPVNLSLTDDKFEGFKNYVFQKTLAPSWGDKYESGNVEVYADGVGSMTAKELSAYLETYFNPASKFSFQVSKNEQGDFVLKMVIDPAKVNDISKADMADASSKISEKVFNGSPLIFELTDDEFKAIRSFAYPADAAGLK
jgi:hypothetical protein